MVITKPARSWQRVVTDGDIGHRHAMMGDHAHRIVTCLHRVATIVLSWAFLPVVLVNWACIAHGMTSMLLISIIGQDLASEYYFLYS